LGGRTRDGEIFLVADQTDLIFAIAKIALREWGIPVRAIYQKKLVSAFLLLN
jgi:hypothetical protein